MSYGKWRQFWWEESNYLPRRRQNRMKLKTLSRANQVPGLTPCRHGSSWSGTSNGGGRCCVSPLAIEPRSSWHFCLKAFACCKRIGKHLLESYLSICNWNWNTLPPKQTYNWQLKIQIFKHSIAQWCAYMTLAFKNMCGHIFSPENHVNGGRFCKICTSSWIFWVEEY